MCVCRSYCMLTTWCTILHFTLTTNLQITIHFRNLPTMLRYCPFPFTMNVQFPESMGMCEILHCWQIGNLAHAHGIVELHVQSEGRQERRLTPLWLLARVVSKLKTYSSPISSTPSKPSIARARPFTCKRRKGLVIVRTAFCSFGMQQIRGGMTGNHTHLVFHSECIALSTGSALESLKR